MKNKIPAGILPFDDNIEFVGDRTNKTVYWFRNGAIHYFADLPLQVLTALQDKYNADEPAQQILAGITGDKMRQLELYTYYMYGDLDSTPDFVDGQLSESENFLDSENCIAIDFALKKITIEGVELNKRDVSILQMIRKELKDEVISDLLNITVSTFNYHKKRLFKKLGVQTKSGLIGKAMEHGILS